MIKNGVCQFVLVHVLHVAVSIAVDFGHDLRLLAPLEPSTHLLLIIHVESVTVFIVGHDQHGEGIEQHCAVIACALRPQDLFFLGGEPDILRRQLADRIHQIRCFAAQVIHDQIRKSPGQETIGFTEFGNAVHFQLLNIYFDLDLLLLR